MLVDVYKSSSDTEKYLCVPAETDITNFRIADLDSAYQNLSLIEKGVEVDPSAPRGGFNSAAIVQDILDHGFAAHSVVISVTGTSGGR